MVRVLVLGAGFGGINAALELRRLLDRRHNVVLVDDAATFRMGLGNLWMLDGRRKIGEGARPLSLLGGKGIEVLRGRIERIDIAKRSAVVDGRELVADGIVIALGARLAPEATPGSPRRTTCTRSRGRRLSGKPFIRSVADGSWSRCVDCHSGAPQPPTRRPCSQPMCCAVVV